MKTLNNFKIIGIDHGYGNIKTANHCFKTGITTHDSEPLFTKDMLTYNGKYYLIGEGHKEFLPEKQNDEDYYVLTLAAIATELADEGLTEADVIIAAGLPLTWTSGQKADFAKYLSQNKSVTFTFRNVEYHIRIRDVKIYPQGYSVVVPIKSTLRKVNSTSLFFDRYAAKSAFCPLVQVNGKPAAIITSASVSPSSASSVAIAASVRI